MDPLSPAPRERGDRRIPWWLRGFVLAALVVEAVHFLWEQALSLPVLEMEEAITPTVAQFMVSGHWRDLLLLQPLPRCGGCTVEALLAVPLFEALGPTIGAWRMIPLGFHLLTLWLMTELSRRISGPVGAVVVCVLFIAAPPFFLDNAIVAWGNHDESEVFVLAALIFLYDAASNSRIRPARSAIQVAAAGLSIGFGLYFCLTVVHGWLAVAFALILVLGAMGNRGGSIRLSLTSGYVLVLAFIAAGVVGLAPWCYYLVSQRVPLSEMMGEISGCGMPLDVASPGLQGAFVTARYLSSPAFIEGLFDRTPVTAWRTIWALTHLMLLPICVVQAWGISRRTGWRSAWVLIGPLLSLGLLSVMAAIPITVQCSAIRPDYVGMRYYTPLYIGVVLTAAMVIAQWVSQRGPTRLAGLLVLSMLGGPTAWYWATALHPARFHFLLNRLDVITYREGLIKELIGNDAIDYLLHHSDRIPEVRDRELRFVAREFGCLPGSVNANFLRLAATDRDRRVIADELVLCRASMWELPSAPPAALDELLQADTGVLRGDIEEAMGIWGVRNWGYADAPLDRWSEQWGGLANLHGALLEGACQASGTVLGTRYAQFTTIAAEPGWRRSLEPLFTWCGGPDTVLRAAGWTCTKVLGCDREEIVEQFGEITESPAFWDGVRAGCVENRVTDAPLLRWMGVDGELQLR